MDIIISHELIRIGILRMANIAMMVSYIIIWDNVIISHIMGYRISMILRYAVGILRMDIP